MKMKKIALALAITATASYANADVEIDLGTVLGTVSNASSSALNLSINNTDVIDASVYVGATTDGLGTLIDNDIKTTALGAVQSGSIEIENAITTNSNESIDASVTSSLQSVADYESTVNNSLVKQISDATANTTNTAAGQFIDQSTFDGVEFISSSATSDAQSAANNLSFAETLTSLNTDFSALNTAYNNADINASVTVSAESLGEFSGVDLGALNGSITTTAIGAVQSGNITVTVK